MAAHNVGRNQRARSHDRAIVATGHSEALGLSRSVLNERYFEADQTTTSPGAAASRSKSLDNLTHPFGLSDSKLNQRYQRPSQPEALSKDSSSSPWVNALGLSTKTSLNDRYFSQPDLLGNKPGLLSEATAIDTLDQDLDQLDMGMKARHGHPRFVKSGGKRKDLKSSAMSDTSEAPSIASHVHRVRVPSQASDVDQFLDDLFSPVLDDGQTVDDGLSDAKSLAASMRGGGDQEPDQEVVAHLSRADSINSSDSTMSGMTKPHVLAPALRGNDGQPEEEAGAEARGGQADQIGFQPIQGQMSPIMSPPPMLMPTPILGGSHPASMTSPLMMPLQTPGGPGGQAMPSQAETSGSAMAFTYVPVPVYNMAGMTMPGVPGMAMATPRETSTPAAAAATGVPAATQPNVGSQGSPPSQPSSLDTQQAAYQQAFLQNAVAQNMQIQQQLMLQNQALTQLLQQSSTPGGAGGPMSSGSTNPSSLSTIMGTPSLPSMIPMSQYMQQQVH